MCVLPASECECDAIATGRLRLPSRVLGTHPCYLRERGRAALQGRVTKEQRWASALVVAPAVISIRLCGLRCAEVFLQRDLKIHHLITFTVTHPRQIEMRSGKRR